MLRSFAYAAESALLAILRDHADLTSAAVPAARAWERDACTAFVDGYREVAGEDTFLPVGRGVRLAARRLRARQGVLRARLRAEQPARLGGHSACRPRGLLQRRRRSRRGVALMTWSPSIGAWPERDGVRFRVWAPTVTTVQLQIERPDSAPVDPHARSRGRRVSRDLGGRGGRGHALLVPARRPRSPARSGVAIAARRRARCVAGRRSRGVRLVGPGGAVADARPRRPGGLRAARRHVHRGRDVRRGHRAAAGARRSRRDGDRADADCRVRRQPQLGLRRRRPVRARPRLRHAERPAPSRRRGPPGRPRRAPRSRLQPPRARRRVSRQLQPVLLHDAAREPVGRRGEPGRRAQRPGAVVLHREHAALAARVPRRRRASRCHARADGRWPGALPGGADDARARGAGRAARAAHRRGLAQPRAHGEAGGRRRLGARRRVGR